MSKRSGYSMSEIPVFSDNFPAGFGDDGRYRRQYGKVCPRRNLGWLLRQGRVLLQRYLDTARVQILRLFSIIGRGAVLERCVGSIVQYRVQSAEYRVKDKSVSNMQAGRAGQGGCFPGNPAGFRKKLLCREKGAILLSASLACLVERVVL